MVVRSFSSMVVQRVSTLPLQVTSEQHHWCPKAVEAARVPLPLGVWHACTVTVQQSSGGVTRSALSLSCTRPAPR